MRESLILEEIYQQVYLHTLCERMMFEEGFFQDLGNRFKVLAPTIALASMIHGSWEAGKTHGREQSGLFTNKTQETSTINNRISTDKDSAKYTNIFNNEQNALSFILKTDRFKITPAQFMRAMYGEDWENVLQKAKKNQANTSNVDFWLKLDDRFLNQIINVVVADRKNIPADKNINSKALGQYIPKEGSIYIVRDAALEYKRDAASRGMYNYAGILNTLAHEIRHSMQSFASGLGAATPAAVNLDPYVGNAAETGVRLAALVQQYYKETRKIPSTETEVKQMLSRYGIEENPYATDMSAKDNLPHDIQQIYYLMDRLLQKHPRLYKYYYDAIVKQVPGLVQQTVRDYRNHV
jgi:hypothetical protein